MGGDEGGGGEGGGRKTRISARESRHGEMHSVCRTVNQLPSPLHLKTYGLGVAGEPSDS